MNYNVTGANTRPEAQFKEGTVLGDLALLDKQVRELEEFLEQLRRAIAPVCNHSIPSSVCNHSSEGSEAACEVSHVVREIHTHIIIAKEFVRSLIESIWIA